MDNYNEVGRARIMRNINETAAYGIKAGTPGFPTTPEGLADETLKKYGKATPDQIERGKNWYQEVHDGTMEAATNSRGPGAPENGYSPEQGAAVMATLSPRRTWDTNYPTGKRIMEVVSKDEPFDIDQATYDGLRTKPPRGPGRYRPSELEPETLAFAHPGFDEKYVRSHQGWTTQVASGIRICRAKPDELAGVLDKELGGPKIRNFYNNIYDPKDRVSVTIDTHQIRAMIPDGLKLGTTGKNPPREWTSDDVDTQFFFSYGSVPGGIKSNTGSYAFFASGMQIASAKLAAQGIDLSPSQLQAVTWLVQMEKTP